jgi:serpin B
VALLGDKYSAEIFRNAGLDEINGWVKRKTEGKIDKIIDQFDPDAAAVLLNAAYFKAAWAAPFSKQDTRPEVFSLSSSQQIQVPTMQKVASCAVAARDGYRAIRLPYAIRAIGMVVVVPDAVDGLAAVSAKLDAAELTGLFTALRARQVREPRVAALQVRLQGRSHTAAATGRHALGVRSRARGLQRNDGPAAGPGQAADR